MDPRWTTLFFGLAMACFVVEALTIPRRRVPARVQLVALGLAFVLVPFLWNAVGAGW